MPEENKIPEADVSHIQKKYLDIKYANKSESQKLDIYLPDTEDGPFPVIFSIHGGAFKMGDKRDIQIIPHLKALKRGYAVVGVNYRLSGEALFPAGLIDLKAAIRWIKANAERYNLNSEKIATWGASAGGHFSAMICFTENMKEFEDYELGNKNYSTDITAAVDWFGPTDFLKMDEAFAKSGKGVCDHNDADSPESLYLGKKITEIPELVQKTNPLNYIHKDIPPIFIQHGSKDHLVPIEQSIILVDKLREIVPENRYFFEIIEGADHGGEEFDCDENVNKVLNFLDRYMK